MPAKKAAISRTNETGKWASVLGPRARNEKRFWLVKSEPETFSFDDLLAAKEQTTCWDGVRNMTARNFLRDGMKVGDKVFFYHSMAEPPAVVGICEVVREAYPDELAFNPKSDYYDEKSKRDNPTWFMVDLKAVKRLKNPVSLHAIKANPALSEMALVRISRLSVTPVAKEEWDTIVEMSSSPAL
jgi:predicted RNA-binding protein with PUA-like domain